LLFLLASVPGASPQAGMKRAFGPALLVALLNGLNRGIASRANPGALLHDAMKRAFFRCVAPPTISSAPTAHRHPSPGQRPGTPLKNAARAVSPNHHRATESQREERSAGLSALVVSFGIRSWGVAPGWDGTGLWPCASSGAAQRAASTHRISRQPRRVALHWDVVTPLVRKRVKGPS
jgi:hypothetical protein